MSAPADDAGPADEPVQGLVVVDRHGVICSWSEGAARLTGHRAAEAIGCELDLIVPAEYLDRHRAGFQAAMASGSARLEGKGANIPIRCADGVVRRWPGRFTLLRDAYGRPAGAGAVIATADPGDPTLFDL